jgi:tricorn protease
MEIPTPGLAGNKSQQVWVEKRRQRVRERRGATEEAFVIVRLISVLFFALFASISASAQDEKPLLMQDPTLNATHIVFAYGGELWAVSREGGAGSKLTNGPGRKSKPRFSPDGKWIAFTGQYNGNLDIYVMPASGGEPRQLTYGPGPDTVEGWTPDGKEVLFRSSRESSSFRHERLFTVPVTGGHPRALPLPSGYQAVYSADGLRLAYTPLPREITFPFAGFDRHAFWKHYHGGLASAIWIAELKDSKVTKLPRENWADFSPMWIGEKIYFLSTRRDPITMFSYDLVTQEVSQLIENHGFDIMSASSGKDAIVYEQFGSLHVYDLKAASEHKVDVRIDGDFRQAQARSEGIGDRISSADVSPNGSRAVFEARGEIVTVAASGGSSINLTHSPGVAERYPSWSPDGKRIAYFSDESGEYALHVQDSDGKGITKKVSLGSPSSFFYRPVWSADSRKIAFTDKRLALWYVDLGHPTPVRVDGDTYVDIAPSRGLNPSWSPDGNWLAYTKLLANHMRALMLYSLATGKSTEVTDGLSDAEHAAFDKSGKYVFFTASTDLGPGTIEFDLSAIARITTRRVYAVLLSRRSRFPSASQNGGQSQLEDKQATDNPGAFGVDLEGIQDRIGALPIAPGNYLALNVGKAGELFLGQAPPGALDLGAPTMSLLEFVVATGKMETILPEVDEYHMAFDGDRILVRKDDKWGIVSTEAPAKLGDGILDLATAKIQVVPREEWKQMYREIWRAERDFFYANNYHGVDLKSAERKYEPFLEGIVDREDLNYLFQEMLGELSVGHMFVSGGDIPLVEPAKVGMLGADYSIDHQRYRFNHIFRGDPMDPSIRGPLCEPGLNVKPGDYLLAVNGHDLRDDEDIDKVLLNTPESTVRLAIASDPEGSDTREITVVPIEGETPLRLYDWVSQNMRRVESMSGGRLAYLYLPNTTVQGLASFNRYFFSQTDKQGIIVDDRFNSGGQAPDYMIGYLQAKTWTLLYTPQGDTLSEPFEKIDGPKAMLINQYAGSGGDLIAWLFQHLGLGPLIGETTWGGGVGIFDYPLLIDGGYFTAPRIAFLTKDGRWVIENEGVPPDQEVELDPHSWREGRDPQLEKAVQVVLQELNAHPPTNPRVPSFPDYGRKP